MRRDDWIFDTKEEAEAFVLGVKWVNDSSVTVTKPKQMAQSKNWYVVSIDEDGEDE